MITYSRRGGMSYERISNLYPSEIYKLPIDFVKGVQFMDLLKVWKDLGFKDRSCESKLAFLIKNCYECYVQRDCEDVLINPLVLTTDKSFRAANPRIMVDDNSLYRQSELFGMEDVSQVNDLERIASFQELRYKKLNA